LRKVLAFTSLVELGTGVALMVDPAIVVRLLVGADLAGAGEVAGRGFGVALLALALACWPSRRGTESEAPAVRGMLVYNALIALYLAVLGTAGSMRGALLWPAAVLHAAVALALLFSPSSVHAPEARP
jgi:hypothetical protein